MISESGKVVAVDGDRVWVQTIRNSACQSCSARQGCGQRALASATGGRANQIRVLNRLNAQVGDDVMLAIEETALLRASLLVYAVPLLLMVAGAMIGHQLSGSEDLAAMVGAGLGLGGGFVLARRAQRKSADQYEPRMTRIVSATVLEAPANPTVF
ncbi:MAG: SoxR reducing system RseC family protein [Marinobacter sp.]|nr:SoxR reducing system RseC family protein [Marinobacter sp.]